MGQDLRELLKKDRGLPINQLSDNHELNFLSKLEQELPVQEKNTKRFWNTNWIRITAGLIMVLSISLSYLFMGNSNNKADFIPGVSDVQNAKVILPKQTSSLASISPEYEKAEQYFLKNIKLGISEITIDSNNQELVQSFMRRLKELDEEYQSLNIELMELGPNPQSIEAMMENLTLRLSLLNRLNSKLKELDTLENENYIDLQA
ncbi:hypothetical protein NBT05_09960 [Aquimarina sp. ERC-38]|uniref:hypothetical protein n=1 Tax=Aquimarina sp. ERC-38 TaxID=2949996 RepID=UPI002246D52A|nr:hypothetical protein [Aquimarina sp. ERC-38]UZO79295.1 hypothetical protein NBT05_09960 [Aquimarina sp. ERC-38]